MNELFKLFARPAFWLVTALAAGSIFYLGTRHIHALVAEATAMAGRERDSHWQSEIHKANADAARRLATQRQEALNAQAEAQAEIQHLKEQLEDMEDANAALPDNNCGIDRERVWLLNKQAGINH